MILRDIFQRFVQDSPVTVMTQAIVLAPVIDELEASGEPLLDGYRTRLLDGNHLPGTEHRMTCCAPPGPRPCRATPW